jgi:hypothetical protein
LPRCCAEHPKPCAFQRFSPTFQKSFFEKGLFRQSQRFALPAAGERQAGKRETLIAKKMPKKRGAYQPSGARRVSPPLCLGMIQRED